MVRSRSGPASVWATDGGPRHGPRVRGPARLGLSAVLSAVLGLGACAGDMDRGGRAVHQGLALSDVVVTEPVTGERSALYLTARDVAGEGDVLLGLEAVGVGRASLHRTGRRGEGMAMAPVDSFPVDPGGELRLRPGSAHGMLEELSEAWAAGDTVQVTLRFRRAGTVEVGARVVGYGELDAIFPPR